MNDKQAKSTAIIIRLDAFRAASRPDSDSRPPPMSECHLSAAPAARRKRDRARSEQRSRAGCVTFHRSKKEKRKGVIPMEKTGIDFNALLHPASAYQHPNDVLNDPDLTTYEKRAILSSWASDACAVDAMPELRQALGQKPMAFDDILDALKRLDPPSEPGLNTGRRWMRVPSRRRGPGGANHPA